MSNNIATALVAIIRGAVEPSVAAPVLAAAGAPAVAQAVNQSKNIPSEIVSILTSILTQGNQGNPDIISALNKLPGPPSTALPNTRPANAIGNAYYAGMRRGFVFGTPLEPKFKRIGQNMANSSYKGWVLEPRPGPGNVPRFEFVHKQYTGFGGGNVKNVIQAHAPPGIAAGLLAIIEGAVKPEETRRVINDTKPPSVPGIVENIGEQTAKVGSGVPISRPIVPVNSNVAKSMWKFPFFARLFGRLRHSGPANQTLKPANQTLKPANQTLKPANQTLKPANQTLKPANQTLKPSLWKRMMGPGRKIGTSFWGSLSWPARRVVNSVRSVSDPPTKTELEKIKEAIELLKKSTNNELVKEFLKEYFPPPVLTGTKPPPSASEVENKLGKIQNSTKMNIENMFKKRISKNGPTNSNISKKLDEELAELEKMSTTRRARRLGELLKIVPNGFPGRKKIESLVLDEIRVAGRNRNPNSARKRLADLKTNLKLGYDNRELMFELSRQNQQTLENIRVNEKMGRRRGETIREYTNRLRNTQRRPYETNDNYNRRIRASRRYNEEPERLREPVVPLTPNQTNAVQNVGGMNKASNIVSQVPGGAPEIAKAAEALNETSGNAMQAVVLKGASPAAVQAVKRLGGSKNAILVLEGISRKRKATRYIARPKKRRDVGVRVKELNKVINSVKKRKLVSLVAHNVTKTNIHADANRLKKYYKKVIKSQILKTPLAKIVKKAASK